MWDNVEVIQHEGKSRVRAKYIYQNPPEITFAPKNSNMDVAMKRTNSIINKLIQKDQLSEFQQEIDKKIAIGCLKEEPK